MKIEEYVRQRGETTDGKKSALFFALFVATNRIETVYNSGMDELTLKQLMLLILVAVSEGETLTRYGEVMGSSRQNIKSLADALEKKSYVTIRQNENDRRAYGLFLTDKARKHFKDTDDYYTKQILALFSEFTTEEIDVMFAFMPKLLAGIQKMHGN
ncbi:MAG: MarR family transcriptional regulator [Clostridiaceae bacterium]|nr:MarR family transcriptional regulator [Clostridiaceae bacterium]